MSPSARSPMSAGSPTIDAAAGRPGRSKLVTEKGALPTIEVGRASLALSDLAGRAAETDPAVTSNPGLSWRLPAGRRCWVQLSPGLAPAAAITFPPCHTH